MPGGALTLGADGRMVLTHRSSIPVVTAVLAVAVERKVPSSLEGASLGILVAGVMIAVWEGAAGSPKGGPIPSVLKLVLESGSSVKGSYMDCIQRFLHYPLAHGGASSARC